MVGKQCHRRVPGTPAGALTTTSEPEDRTKEHIIFHIIPAALTTSYNFLIASFFLCGGTDNSKRKETVKNFEFGHLFNLPL